MSRASCPNGHRAPNAVVPLMKTKFIKWHVFPLPGGFFGVSNLTTTLRAKSEKTAKTVARIKNRDRSPA